MRARARHGRGYGPSILFVWFLASCMCASERSLSPGWASAAEKAPAVSFPHVRQGLSPFGVLRDASRVQAGHGMETNALEDDAPVPCNGCQSEATMGLARRHDGLWARFLCARCYDRESAGGVALLRGEDGAPVAVDVFGLAGKCRQCRTKASYGKLSSPPLRCVRHKRASDVVRALGTTCMFGGCKKARLFGNHGGVAQYCAAHRLPDHVDVKNKRCQFYACKRQASYGDSATRIKMACAMHRLPGHVDLKHERKRCAAPEGCCKLGVFKRRLSAANPFPPGCSTPEDGSAKTMVGQVQRMKSGAQQESSLPNRTREDGWVFVCAAHLNLNVFSSSSPHQEGLRKKLVERKRRQTSRGLYAHIAEVLEMPSPYSRVSLLRRAIEHLSNISSTSMQTDALSPPPSDNSSQTLCVAGMSPISYGGSGAGEPAHNAAGGGWNGRGEGDYSSASRDLRQVYCLSRMCLHVLALP